MGYGRLTKTNRYHWALLVGAKNEKDDRGGTRYHAKNAPGQSTWIFEEKQTTMTATNMVLVRIMIGKISNQEALSAKLRQVPIVNGNPHWNCVTWVQNALAIVAQNGSVMGTSNLDWETIRNAAMLYCKRKTEQGRFTGSGSFDTTKVPTFDLLVGKETVP